MNDASVLDGTLGPQRLAEADERARVKGEGRGLRARHASADLGKRAALEVAQLDHLAMVLSQTLDRFGHALETFAASDLVERRAGLRYLAIQTARERFEGTFASLAHGVANPVTRDGEHEVDEAVLVLEVDAVRAGKQIGERVLEEVHRLGATPCLRPHHQPDSRQHLILMAKDDLLQRGLVARTGGREQLHCLRERGLRRHRSSEPLRALWALAYGRRHDLRNATRRVDPDILVRTPSEAAPARSASAVRSGSRREDPHP